MTAEINPQILLKLARAAMSRELGVVSPAPLQAHLPFLKEKGATFVTLMKQGELRGCIGTLEATRSLIEDVTANAVAAAFRDPRFPPVVREELGLITIEISLLSQAEAIDFSSEEQALAQLRPYRDGVIFKYHHHHSTFLPQVWEVLPTPKEFMAHLKVKAGLSENFWSEEIRLFRYSVTKWCESEER